MQKIARKVKIINKKISVNNEKHEIKKKYIKMLVVIT